MPKPFMTYEQQLTKLKDEKHILIPDEAKAKAKLQEIGYYSLVTGYKHIFRVPGQKIYKNGTSFDEIVSLYEFDEAIRALFLRYLLHIEQHLRSLLSYYFTEKYGENQSAYSNAANYNTVAKHQRGIGRLIFELENLSKSKNYPYIEYQRNTYNNVPLWVLVNAMTFGSLSKMYILSSYFNSFIKFTILLPVLQSPRCFHRNPQYFPESLSLHSLQLSRCTAIHSMHRPNGFVLCS